MKAFYEFDLSQDKVDSTLIDLSKVYGKLNGFLLADELGLTSTKKGVIVFTDTKGSLIDNDSETVFLCRTDAPLGYGRLMPRGRDLRQNEIKPFLDELKSIKEEAALLCFQHPSIDLTGRYIPRYKTQGAASVILNANDNITIEYVGAGFDVGDLTRGKTVHASIVIPWSERNMPPTELYRLVKRNVYFSHEISQDNYVVSRAERMKELSSLLDENDILEIENSIPLEKPLLSRYLFSKIYSLCVDKLSNCQHKLGNNFGALINIYGSHLYVFEIWKKERSI
jgi:hypothetical protein